jgi:hypothetical protein
VLEGTRAGLGARFFSKQPKEEDWMVRVFLADEIRRLRRWLKLSVPATDPRASPASARPP